MMTTWDLMLRTLQTIDLSLNVIAGILVLQLIFHVLRFAYDLRGPKKKKKLVERVSEEGEREKVEVTKAEW